MEPTTADVRGVGLDAATRCVHYHSPRDIIAIRMMCCGVYYACIDCHQALADHPAEVWPRAQWACPAVLCGNCRRELSIAEYMASEDQCPACSAPFNPGCRDHYPLYFDIRETPSARSGTAPLV